MGLSTRRNTWACRSPSTVEGSASTSDMAATRAFPLPAGQAGGWDVRTLGSAPKLSNLFRHAIWRRAHVASASRAFEACGLSPDETDPEKRYRAVVTALDKAIGRVLDALEKADAANNTFLFFMSDIGSFTLGREGLDVGSNAPLRHGGVTCWESGLCVAAMARWPGKIPAGSVVSQPLWSPDLLVASVKLAGAKLPGDVVFDGKNLLPILTKDAPSPYESFYFAFRSHAALRQGDWKIVREKPDRPWQLFNLTEDLSEAHNLAGEQPERVKELAAAFARWEASF